MTDHDSQEQPPEEIDWARMLRRRFLSVRALLWPAVIVAVALLLSRYDQQNKPKPQPLRQPPPRATSQLREPPSISALPAQSGHAVTKPAL